ncbi:CHASE2 domain-containing protein [Lyngbya confervoides]|uniref:Adenylate/guanylate cyclase domain-containing protein n=1 Tax=Lyngbya confervoides BDU141951 TaxID=1574623 RepID=A0ABD4SZ10_9CYAN|nr:adenylate/guanylate cyclase domain-containing protein [Lyngbya confervoides]MCM1981386.1 adenylate/guanylate cyclase domain-containing protein [Lyngbya confervoides BDU141951]
MPELAMVIIASTIVTGFLVSARQWRVFELFELVAYDRFVQMRPPQPVDSRLLVIGVTEQDLQDQGGKLQLPDQVYARLLQRLLAQKARVIGLDIYRDFPVEPGHAELVQVLESSDRIIGITRLGDAKNPPVDPPPALPPEQVGFNDATQDVGGVIRRSILYQESTQGEILSAFSLLLAERYLLEEGIESQASRDNPNYLQLGATTFVPLSPHDGSYINADVGGYQILLNYRGRQTTIPQVSLGEVLNGRVDPALIRDRIVLIGTTASSGNDFAYTPFSSDREDDLEQRMPGVVVHAQMVSQFLDAALGQRALFWFWSETEEILWLSLWSLLGGMLAWTVRHPLLLALGAAAALGILFQVCLLLFLNMGWVPLIPAALGFLFSGGSVVTYTAQQAQQQRRMVMRLLGQSTSPQIAETLWQRRDELLENGKLPGQELTTTLLFTDLKGFSTISEQYPPEVVFIWLNEYLEEMTGAIQNHEGVINKFTGDGVMAVFGVPIPHESPAEIAQDANQAVACALEMQERLAQLNQRRQATHCPLFKMRVGVFTGPVVVGSLGSKIRLEYGVIGDSVNTASRLESFDKDRQTSDCRILIARQTLNYLDERYQVEAWGNVPLKGKEEPIEVFQVLGRRPEGGVSPPRHSRDRLTQASETR